jgi:hypothetical protein
MRRAPLDTEDVNWGPSSVVRANALYMVTTSLNEYSCANAFLWASLTNAIPLGAYTSSYVVTKVPS